MPMAFPSEIRAGDAIEWTDELAPAANTYIYYFRTNAASGATVSGTLSSGIWTFTLSGGTTGAFTPGQWFYQAIRLSKWKSWVFYLHFNARS